MVILREQVRTLTQIRGGRTPFTQETWMSKGRWGIELKLDEKLSVLNILLTDKVSLYPYARGYLDDSEETHFIDGETGLPTPIIIPVGYNYLVIETNFSFDQPIEGHFITDGSDHSSYIMDALGQTFVHYVVTWEVSMIDPTFSSPHTVDITAKNLGNVPSRGFGLVLGLITKVGSEPWPKIKTVKCKFCGHEQKVSQKTTQFKCENCDTTNLILTLPFGGRV